MDDCSFNAILTSTLGSLVACAICWFGGIWWQKAGSKREGRWRVRTQRAASVFVVAVVVVLVLVGTNWLVAASKDKALGIKPYKSDSSALNDDDRYKIDQCEMEATVFAERVARNPNRADSGDALERFRRCVRASGFESAECLGSDSACRTFFDLPRRRWGDRR